MHTPDDTTNINSIAMSERVKRANLLLIS